MNHLFKAQRHDSFLFELSGSVYILYSYVLFQKNRELFLRIQIKSLCVENKQIAVCSLNILFFSQYNVLIKYLDFKKKHKKVVKKVKKNEDFSLPSSKIPLLTCHGLGNAHAFNMLLYLSFELVDV